MAVFISIKPLSNKALGTLSSAKLSEMSYLPRIFNVNTTKVDFFRVFIRLEQNSVVFIFTLKERCIFPACQWSTTAKLAQR